MDLLQAKAFYFYARACGWKGLEKRGETLLCSSLLHDEVRAGPGQRGGQEEEEEQDLVAVKSPWMVCAPARGRARC